MTLKQANLSTGSQLPAILHIKLSDKELEVFSSVDLVALVKAKWGFLAPLVGSRIELFWIYQTVSIGDWVNS